MKSLCADCRHVRRIVSGKGSTFLLCQLSLQNNRYAKYPPQPVVQCSAYQADGEHGPPPPKDP